MKVRELRRSIHLPLLYETPDAWADEALRDSLALLSDHAYLERKAASNALELLNRWPEPHCPPDWTLKLSSIARDEATHLNLVIRLIKKRGGTLARLHRSTYAFRLRGLVRRGLGPDEIVDRLLVSALIEARSCERFEILARLSGDPDLEELYRNLWQSESGHYTVFLDLAMEVRPKPTVSARWREMLEAEARIIATEPPGSCLHSSGRPT